MLFSEKNEGTRLGGYIQLLNYKWKKNKVRYRQNLKKNAFFIRSIFLLSYDIMFVNDIFFIV